MLPKWYVVQPFSLFSMINVINNIINKIPPTTIVIHIYPIMNLPIAVRTFVPAEPNANSKSGCSSSHINILPTG